jgi:hypothetical protein
VNCGGDLTRGGEARKTGQRVRTVAEAQTRRPPAQSAPEPTQKRKAPTAAILIISLAVILGCIILLIMLLRTDDVTATVSDLQWERSVAIEAYTNVTDSDWRDQVPANAEVTSCSMIYRFTSAQPQVNATEVCGEPYVEDTGTGLGEVVQDCEYEVYDDYCEYTMMAWVAVGTVTETGRDQSPFWPELNLEPDQREGDRNESYTIVFRDDGDSYRYTMTDARLFSRAELGSRWTLQINQLGSVQSLEPAN